MDRLRRWARRVWRDVLALWLAGRDRRTPRAARLLAAAIAAYALSPIDFIPDFIPVLGLLDEAILLPLLVLLAIRLVPEPLWEEMRREAGRRSRRPVSLAGAMAVCILWLATACVAAWWLLA